MDLKILSDALIAQYPSPKTDDLVVDKDALVKMLRLLQTEGTKQATVLDEVEARLQQHKLSPEHHAMIACLDDWCAKAIFEAKFPDDISRHLIAVVAYLNRVALIGGIVPLTQDHPGFKILESLFDLSIGLNDLSGASKESIVQKIEETLAGLSLITDTLGSDKTIETARNLLLVLMQKDLAGFAENEKQKISKLEQRLMGSEAGRFKAVQARQNASEILNEKMSGQTLPETIVMFLQGVWLDSLHIIATRSGLKSQQWYRAIKLTETLLMTLQPESSSVIDTNDQDVTTSNPFKIDDPADSVETMLSVNIEDDSHSSDIDPSGVEPGLDDELVALDPMSTEVNTEDLSTNQEPENAADGDFDDEIPADANKNTPALNKQDLYQIIENLPKELRASLVSLEHTPDAADNAVTVIEEVYVEIMKGNQPAAYEFEPIQIDEGLLENNTTVSRSLLEPVTKFTAGQWFVYTEDNQPSQHIKLTLKLDELEYLLFTNRNGAKVLNRNFEEFAYLLASETVVALPQIGDISGAFRAHLTDLGKRQVKKEKKMNARIANIVKRAEARDKSNLDDTQFVLVAIQKDRLVIKDDPAVHSEAARLVSQLNLGATLKLEGSDDKTVEVKLAADDPADDNVIFVDETGLNLGEFDKSQIADLIAAGKCEVVDDGNDTKDDFRNMVNRMIQKKRLSAD